MVLTPIQQSAFTMLECKNFLHPLLMSLTKNRSDCDGFEVTMPQAVWDQGSSAVFAEPLMVYMNIINLGPKTWKKVVDAIPPVMEKETPRLQRYLSVCTPVLFPQWGNDYSKEYHLRSGGFEQKPRTNGVDPGLAFAILSDWMEHIDLPFERTLSVGLAFHILYLRRFCPEYFKATPTYGRARDANQLAVLRGHIQDIQVGQPDLARELSDVLAYQEGLGVRIGPTR